MPILLTGLSRLEYRGYDSSGVALFDKDEMFICKAAGKLENLKAKLEDNNFYSTLGFAHTRWATHGGATETNAHPHISNHGDLVGVHNGVVENYLTLKKKLEESGYKFYSQTDTEVVINFIDWVREDQKLDLMSAVQVALSEIVGTCVLVLYSKSERSLMAVNKGGQLFAGINGSDCFISSDNVAFAGYADDCFEIKDGQLWMMKDGQKPVLLNLSLETLMPLLEKINVDILELELGNFPHFMLKEVFSQPQVVRYGLAGRVDFQKGEFCFGGLTKYWPQIKSAETLVIVACGTSYYAGLLGKYWLEKLAGISVRVEYASEFQSANIKSGDLVLGISQSGTTADTLSALEMSKERGAVILGICNVVGSTMSRLTHAGIYTRAGVENGVASTKAFTAQVLALLLLALKLSSDKKVIPEADLKEIIGQLENLPNLMEKVLETNVAIKRLAKKFKKSTNCLYLGRGYNYPIALEGALKLKELSYIHAEGMPAGESKHGPLALIDAKMPVVVIATSGEAYGKTISNLAEIKARGGRVIVVVTEGDEEASKLADELIVVPMINEVLAPILNVIPLQLFAYHLALLKGCDIDHPRNLAKSVTVH
ncbi:MAG: glutamine--fructose-6-phosphate transaminase (isomerizing) [Candidatus Falkowbacteria bacterium]